MVLVTMSNNLTMSPSLRVQAEQIRLHEAIELMSRALAVLQNIKTREKTGAEFGRREFCERLPAVLRGIRQELQKLSFSSAPSDGLLAQIRLQRHHLQMVYKEAFKLT